MSGISAINEITLPSGNFLGSSPEGITTGPDNNLWFTENAANAIGMFNPATDASRRVHHPDGRLWTAGDYGGARWQPLVHREAPARSA